MLTQQVLDVCVGRQSRGYSITSTEIEPHIRSVQIAVWQQHRRAEIGIREEVAVVSPRDQRTGQRAIESRARVVQSEISRVWSNTKWPSTHKRRKRPYRNVG